MGLLNPRGIVIKELSPKIDETDINFKTWMESYGMRWNIVVKWCINIMRGGGTSKITKSFL